jgi:hypothetical protein
MSVISRRVRNGATALLICACSATALTPSAFGAEAHDRAHSTQSVSVSLTQVPRALTAKTSARFTWKTVGTVRRQVCSLDGGAAKTCRSGVSYRALSHGSHRFIVRVVGGRRRHSSDAKGTVWTVSAGGSAPAPTTSASGTPTASSTPTTAAPTTTTTTSPATPTTTSPVVSSGSGGNSYASDMFGVATGSTLQNEDGSPAMAQDLNLDKGAGAEWIRIDINWAQIQAGGPNSYNWTNIDDAVEAAEARGMSVLGTIVYSPNWAVPAGQNGTYSPNPTLYAAFAAKAAQHYAALGVQDFEIWNEPNQVASWTPAPNVAAYTTLLKDADTSIKAVDPAATVITGGLSPAASDGTNISPTDFLQGIYANGGKGYFDAVGMHPYCNPDLPGAPDDWSAWYQMYGTPTSLRSIMVANGDGALKIWGTEFGTPSAGQSGLTPAFQAQTVTTAYQLWSTYSWAGPLFFYEGRDNGTDATSAWDNYGFADVDFSLKPSYYAFQQAGATL